MRLEDLDDTVPRPWVDHYPEGIVWNDEIDVTPVHERVLDICARHPDRPALDFLGAVTHFGELGESILAFAAGLQRDFGVGRGTRVALLLPNTPYFVIAYYAVLRAGGTVVNCNPLYTVSELGHIVRNAGADLIVTLDIRELFAKAETLCRSGHVKRVIVGHFPTLLPMVKRVLYSIAKRGDLADVGASEIADRVTWFDRVAVKGAEPAPIRLDPAEDVAVQQYTGGTTGLPRGAMLTHANIAANVSQIDKWGCGLFYPPSKVVAVLPFFHIFAMTVCMNVPLGNGTQVVMLPRFDIKSLLDLMMRTRANVLPAVPTLLGAIARAKGAQEAMASLEVAISGGAALPAETRAAFGRMSKALLAEGYGLTEASPVVCCSALRVPGKPMSIGQPIPGTDVRLIDVETGKPAALGERGELQVRGPQVMAGYYQDPQATASSFDNGWLRSGDIAQMDEDGYFYIVDRIKDLIICSGYNIYPRVIEEAIAHHPAVEEVTVIGVPDRYRGEAPVAFVKLRAGESADEAGIKAFLADRLNKLEQPREVIFKDALPKTLIGKLSKKELREEYAAQDHGQHHEPV